MVRLIRYLLAVALLVGAAVWLAGHPGVAVVEWLGWKAQIPVALLLAALLAAILPLLLVLRLVGYLWRLPLRLRNALRDRRRHKGYQALSDGLAAVTLGEGRKAGQLAAEASRLLQDDKLTGFLSAQAAQLSGDTDAAREAYTALTGRSETEALGLRGLYEQAVAAGQDQAVIDYGRRLHSLSPADAAQSDQMLAAMIRQTQLTDALSWAEDARRRGIYDSARGARIVAALLTRQASGARDAADARTALELAKKAVKTDPGYDAAALLLAGLQADAPRRAAKVLEDAWKLAPTLPLAKALDALRPGETALERVQRLEKLAKATPGHPLAQRLLGEACLEAKMWGQARRHLTALADSAPSAAVFSLLARLERAEYANEPAAQGWLEKAEKTPVASEDHVCAGCHAAFPQWTLLCPGCNRVDSLSRPVSAAA